MKNEIDRSNTPLTFNWVEDNEHHHHRSKRPAGPMVYYGPLTFEAHERYQQNKEAPNIVTHSSSDSAVTAKDEPKKTTRTLPTVAEVVVVITTTSLAFVVAIPFGLLVFFLIESSIRILRNTLHSFRIASAADAAIMEIAEIINKTSFEEVGLTSVSAAILKYAKMAPWPFVLFVPSFFLYSHLVVGMTSENQSRDRKKMTWKVLLSLISLFAFLEMMLAMADTSKWTLLGITSVFPLLMMILARFSIASADMYGSLDILSPCGNYTVAATTMDSVEGMERKFSISRHKVLLWCTLSLTSSFCPQYTAQTPAAIASAIVLVAFFATIAHSCSLVDRKRNHRNRLSTTHGVFAALSISEAIILAKEWYSERSILLFLAETLGFLFIFLPFIAGIVHRLLEPLYILSVPLSSLAICTITGLSPVSLIGLVVSILLAFIGTNILLCTLLLSYRFYSWLIHRHLTLLIFFAWLVMFTGLLNESEVMH